MVSVLEPPHKCLIMHYDPFSTSGFSLRDYGGITHGGKKYGVKDECGQQLLLLS